jgi:hypothetical protein
MKYSVLVTLFATGFPFVAPSQGVLDQSFEPLAPNIFAVNFNGVTQGQTFTVGISGSLVEVDVYIARNELQTEGDISWELTAVGQSGVLASGELSVRRSVALLFVSVMSGAVGSGWGELR